MIVSACVRFHTNEYNKIPWDDRTKIPSTMFDIPCHRHADAFYIISQFLDAGEIDKPRTEQGFLTQDGTFLNRYDAMDEAIKCNQLPPSAKEARAELYSEDLW
jgi:hypothetical protein